MAKKHKKLVFTVVLLGVLITSGAVGAAYYYQWGPFASDSSKVKTFDDYTECSDGFMALYNKDTQALYDTSGTDDAYIKKVNQYAEKARTFSDYQSNINCIYISYWDNYYSGDASATRADIDAYRQLNDEGKSVSSSMEYVYSIDDMELNASSLEHNQSIDKDSGEYGEG